MATKREHRMARRAGQYKRLWREEKQRREQAERDRAHFSRGVMRFPREKAYKTVQRGTKRSTMIFYGSRVY
jgi:hypothetical protein